MFLFLFLATSAKYFSNQVIFKLTDREYSVNQVPFPSITVCSSTIAYRKLINLTNFDNLNFTDDDLAAFQILDLVHDKQLLKSLNISLSTDNFMENLRNLTLWNWFNDTFEATWLQKFDVPVSEVITKWGICMNFNLYKSESLLNLDEWNSMTTQLTTK